MRKHFNASRDYALFTTHHIRIKGRLVYISPYFTHLPIKSPSQQPTSFTAQKNLLPLTIAQTDVFFCEATSTQAATMRGLPHTISGSKVAYVTLAHIFPTFLSRAPHCSQQVHCTKKSFAVNHGSYGLILLRRHFNASRDYAHFTPHHIRMKGRLVYIKPYFFHITIKGPS